MNTERTSDIYQTPRIVEPSHETIALSSTPFDELFAADRAVGAAAVDPDHYIDIEAYRQNFGWIRWLLKSPTLRGAESLLVPADADAANRALSNLPGDSPVRRVVRAVRSLLQHGEELRRFSADLVQAMAERTYDADLVLVQERQPLKDTWDSIDFLRIRRGLPPLLRIATRQKRVLDDAAVALTLGIPHCGTAGYRWACWPPIAPRIISFGWAQEIPRAIRRNELDLGELGSLWKWRCAVTHVLIDWPVAAERTSASSDALPETDIDDPWDEIAGRSGSGYQVQVRRFRVHGGEEIVTDKPRNDSAVSPFLALVGIGGRLIIGEDAGDTSAWRLVMVFAVSVTTDDDRRRIHEIPELRELKRRLSALTPIARDSAITRIASATRKAPDAVRALFKGWCGSTPDCPYLPESDDAFRMLVAAAGLSEKAGQVVKRRVERAIGDSIRDGLRESREWKQACEAARLSADGVAGLERGLAVRLDVKIPGRWTGQVELVPLAEEIEEPWHA